MGIVQSLAKVEAEVQQGTPASLLRARQRLQGLIGTYPDRLDLRERLAEVYRILGDPAQAGRWSYLAAERDPREIAAFERAYQSSVNRMAALSWRRPIEDASTAVARERLTMLLEAARVETGRPLAKTLRELTSSPPPEESWWARYAVMGGLLLAFAFMVVGLITVIRWPFS